MTAIPALPDTERRTEYLGLSANAGPFSVGFDVYGTGTDYANWIGVYLDGEPLTAVTDYTLDSVSGSLSTLARPITNARITPAGAYAAGFTGDLQIVGAERPRRTAQLDEGSGVSAHDFNQFANQLTARQREAWNRFDRTLQAPPGETFGLIPDADARADMILAFDSDGNPTVVEITGAITALSANQVTDTYLADMGACSVKGRAANSSGDPADISAGSNNTFFGRMSNALGFFTLTAILDAVIGSTRGMLMVRGASAWQSLAIGTSAKILTSDGTDPSWQTPVAQLPRGSIDGCTLSNNGSDATNDIDIAAGKCRDSTDTYNITCAAMTKRLDANWSAGTGNGGRYSGAAITDTTYHVYAATKADGTQDYYFDPSATPATVLGHLQAESGGADYVGVRRIGSIVRASSAILGFVQDGDDFDLKVAVNDVATVSAPGTSARTDTLASVPNGIVVTAKIGVAYASASALFYALATSLDQTDSVPSITKFSWYAPVSIVGGVLLRVKTNASRQFRIRFSDTGASNSYAVNTHGWVDRRGKDA